MSGFLELRLQFFRMLSRWDVRVFWILGLWVFGIWGFWVFGIVGFRVLGEFRVAVLVFFCWIVRFSSACDLRNLGFLKLRSLTIKETEYEDTWISCSSKWQVRFCQARIRCGVPWRGKPWRCKPRRGKPGCGQPRGRGGIQWILWPPGQSPEGAHQITKYPNPTVPNCSESENS